MGLPPEEIKELQEDLRVGSIMIANLTDQCRELEAQLAKAHRTPDRECYDALKYIIRELDKAGIIKADSIFMEMPNRAIALLEEEK